MIPSTCATKYTLSGKDIRWKTQFRYIKKKMIQNTFKKEPARAMDNDARVYKSLAPYELQSIKSIRRVSNS